MGKRTVSRCGGRNGECGDRRRSDHRSRWTSEHIPLYRRASLKKSNPTSLFITISIWTNARVDVGTGSIMESHENTLFRCVRSIKNGLRKRMVREWKPMNISKSVRVLPSAANRIFLQKYSLKLQMISKQILSSYHVNRLTCLTPISIHRSRFLRLGQGARTRTASWTHQPRPRRGVASAIDAVTINLHVSSMKFGLIGTTPMTWYYQISSRMLSNRTGTVLAGINNVCDFTSKPAIKTRVNGAKHAERHNAFFLKNQDRAFKHHQHHNLFFRDRFLLRLIISIRPWGGFGMRISLRDDFPL